AFGRVSGHFGAPLPFFPLAARPGPPAALLRREEDPLRRRRRRPHLQAVAAAARRRRRGPAHGGRRLRTCPTRVAAHLAAEPPARAKRAGGPYRQRIRHAPDAVNAGTRFRAGVPRGMTRKRLLVTVVAILVLLPLAAIAALF